MLPLDLVLLCWIQDTCIFVSFSDLFRSQKFSCCRVFARFCLAVVDSRRVHQTSSWVMRLYKHLASDAAISAFRCRHLYVKLWRTSYQIAPCCRHKQHRKPTSEREVLILLCISQTHIAKCTQRDTHVLARALSLTVPP